MGAFNVRLSLVGLRHAHLDQFVQGPPEGSPNEGGAPARAGGGDAFQLPSQRLVHLHYKLLCHTQSINGIHEDIQAGPPPGLGPPENRGVEPMTDTVVGRQAPPGFKRRIGKMQDSAGGAAAARLAPPWRRGRRRRPGGLTACSRAFETSNNREGESLPARLDNLPILLVPARRRRAFP